MTRPAIRIQGVSKRYRIGESENHEDTLAGAILSAARKPFGNLRKLRRLAHFDEEDSSDVIWALRDVSFDVGQGEVIGIIGRNGAGKSTLLKILSRITSPTSGRIELAGRVASLLEVGTGFHPELTGRENIYLNGTILGMRKAEVDAKLDEIIDFSGVSRFADTPLKRYSSGMAVRLAFSVAAHLEPEILLIDEVLAVGDAEFRKKCLGKMRDVGKQGRTVLFVSHNLAAVTQLCDRSILLDGGRVESKGPTEAVVATYLSGSSPESGERTWRTATAPGDESFRLHAVRVCMDGSPSATVDISKPIKLEIEYEILHEIHNLRLGFHLLSQLGTVVLQSGDQTVAESAGVIRTPGHYRSVCTIPAHLLNAIPYSLTIVADIPFVRLIFQETAALNFHIERTSGDQGIYPETGTGLVAPRLEWEIETLDEESASHSIETGLR